jgi:hypothetical protein
MKSNTITDVVGILMVVASGVFGMIDALLLAGAGICGFPLTWGIVRFAIATAVLPVGTVGVLSKPWWWPAVVFSVPFGFSILLGALTQEWYRVLASIACIAVAFGGAWLFRPWSRSEAKLKFKDEELERVYDLNFRAMQNLQDEGQRQVCGLLAAFDWFRLIEGEQSPQVLEAKDLLLSPEMRPALRRWYRRFGNDMNPGALELRAQLSELAGEKFG